MKPQTISLLTHTQPEQTHDAVRAAARVARDAGVALVASEAERAKHGEAAEGVGALEELAGEPDLCLVLGGDGTILKALREHANSTVPVFGINFGTIGFLAAADTDELDEGLAHAVAGDFEVMSLPALELGAPARPGSL